MHEEDEIFGIPRRRQAYWVHERIILKDDGAVYLCNLVVFEKSQLWRINAIAVSHRLREAFYKK